MQSAATLPIWIIPCLSSSAASSSPAAAAASAASSAPPAAVAIRTFGRDGHVGFDQDADGLVPGGNFLVRWHVLKQMAGLRHRSDSSARSKSAASSASGKSSGNRSFALARGPSIRGPTSGRTVTIPIAIAPPAAAASAARPATAFVIIPWPRQIHRAARLQVHREPAGDITASPPATTSRRAAACGAAMRRPLHSPAADLNPDRWVIQLELRFFRGPNASMSSSSSNRAGCGCGAGGEPSPVRPPRPRPRRRPRRRRPSREPSSASQAHPRCEPAGRIAASPPAESLRSPPADHCVPALAAPLPWCRSAPA